MKCGFSLMSLVFSFAYVGACSYASRLDKSSSMALSMLWSGAINSSDITLLINCSMALGSETPRTLNVT